MSPDSKFEVVKFLERGFVPLEINALRYDLGERTFELAFQSYYALQK